jgi:lysophospholipid acyltransferase (LPLAT)-like uncharacterized protein
VLKAWFRRPGVQAALAFLLWAYVRFTLATVRWRIEGQDAVAALWDQPRASRGGAIVCFWHSRIVLSPACWPLGRAQPPKAMISLSPDGAFIAATVERLGFPAIRGSSRKDSDPGNDKGGGAALREALRWIRGGGGLAITPDGPRGPAETMKDGAVVLAKAAAVPVFFVGLACRPALRLKSWDRSVLPLPFARGAIVWTPGTLVDRTADTAETAAAWAAALSAVTRRAEALAGVGR